MKVWCEITQKLTAVTAKNLLINDRHDWKAIETVCEGLPEFDIITTLA